MIVVLADDLSGAAELAGIARGHGLAAEVHRRFNPDTRADLVAIDTDSRSLPPDQAAARLREITAAVLAARPDWIYKKTDSVLRGNILAEINAVAETAGKPRALFIPANPRRQRVIVRGHYGVEQRPLNQTAFAHDPEYPATTSRVDLLLTRSGGQVKLIGPNDPLTECGIHVPDAWEPQHLESRARSLAEDTLAAGAAEFFEAILKRRLPSIRSLPPEPQPRNELKLFVCGSQAAWATTRRADCAAHAVPIVPMPRRLFEDDFEDAEIDQWARETLMAFEICPRVLLAIGGEMVRNISPDKYVNRLAEAAGRVIKWAPIGRVYLEGGATATALMRLLDWENLRVLKPLGPGLASLEVIDRPAPLLTIKPGSYPWPGTVWEDAAAPKHSGQPNQ